MNIKSIKKWIVLLYLGLLLYSGFMDFFVVPEANVSLMVYSVKGFKIVLLAGVFYAYSFFTNKKSITALSLGATVVGYIFTIVALINAKVSLSMCSSGAYVYFASFILCIISLLIPSDTSLSSEVSKIAESIPQTEEIKNIDGDYFICNYMSGVKGVKNIYKSISVFILKNNTNALEINIKAPEEIKIVIDDSNISKINLSKEMRVSVSDIQKEDNTVETQYLASVLVGSFGPIVGEKLAKDRGVSTKANFDSYYKIEIFYKVNEEENRLVFQTEVNPKSFFKKYENIIETKY